MLMIQNKFKLPQFAFLAQTCLAFKDFCINFIKTDPYYDNLSIS